MTAAMATAAAVTFGWLGMVVAISFVEAPLKFRAPGVTVRVGLGIGRLVFRALNAIEIVLAAVVLIGVAVDPPRTAAVVALGLAVLVLAAQLVVVRPCLTRRSDAVLAGADPPRSRAHYAYVVLEGIKVIALLVGGVLVISA